VSSSPKPSPLVAAQFFVAEQLTRKKSLPKDAETAARAADFLTGNDRLSPVEQLEIYREQFWLRHTGALVEDFPGLSGILGQSEWEKLAESYLTALHSPSFTLRDLGERLPEHVEECTWLSHHALCLDMARLEWAYVELFDAPEAPPLDPKKVASLTAEQWQGVVVTFDPALQLMQVGYPVAELRRALCDTTRTEPVAIPEADAQNLVLYRGKNLNLFHSKVSQPAYELLGALHAGTPLVSACEKVIDAHPADAESLEAKVFGWFGDWGERGWIVDVNVT